MTYGFARKKLILQADVSNGTSAFNINKFYNLVKLFIYAKQVGEYECGI